ncbi:GbpC/Spa domain-containing protein, partial [Streptococcus sobrinus]
QYAAAKAQYDAAKVRYDQDKAQYDADKAEYDIAKVQYDSKLAEKQEADAFNQAEEERYTRETEQYQKDKADYEEALSEYTIELKEYQTKLAQYENAKEAYNKFIADHGLTEAAAAQELVFLKEPNATHTITGIDTYLKKEAQQRLGASAVKQYDSNALTDGDIVSNSPWDNKGAEWLVIKEGDKFTVTYDGLSQSEMIINGKPQPITKVVYHYTVEELPSANGKGIAKVDGDPTVTLTVGASTDDPQKEIRITVDVEFYDKNGQKYDLSQRKAILALNSLNHWTGAAYANGSDNPRELVVEAKDINGNPVRGTWNPYADGSSPALNNGAPVVKSGRATFDNGAIVDYSADNPLKIVTVKYSWNGQMFAPEDGIVTDATTVNASGGGNGHSTGTEDYQFNGNDDVLGTYTIDPTSGLITFTPKKKFQSTEHQEFVNIGDKEFVAIPNSSVTY